MSDSLRELYQEVIIDHNRHPRNFGHLASCNHQAEGMNPLCGDKLNVYLLLENDRITDLSFEGKGCAISTASASIMTEVLKNKTKQEAERIFQQFHDLVMGKIPLTMELGKLAVLAGVKDYPARVKCATLAWHTLHAALHDSPELISTEE
ncbi:MAG: SUF system NifU family Fe-S cluster assembly protein [Legionellales bacterium]|nr:SUF system NifU family Fe-S cluster assembly protein [Legionellales bacterium]